MLFSDLTVKIMFLDSYRLQCTAKQNASQTLRTAGSLGSVDTHGIITKQQKLANDCTVVWKGRQSQILVSKFNFTSFSMLIATLLLNRTKTPEALWQTKPGNRKNLES